MGHNALGFRARVGMHGSWERLPVVDLEGPAWWQQPAASVQYLVESGHRAAYVPEMDAPMLLRYQDIRDVLAMPQLGALGIGMLGLVGWTEGPFVDAFRQWLVTMDPPDHTRLRRLVSQPFTPRRVDAMQSSARAVANHLADEMAGTGSIELYGALGERLPLMVLCDVLGVPAGDHSVMARWIQPMSECLGNPTPALRDAADDAMLAFSAYVRTLIEERRRSPGDDLLSSLIEAEESSHRLSDAELVATTAQLLFAGLETTRDLIGATVFSLLCHPAQFAQLRATPTLVANTIEEVLRYEPPVVFLSRPAAFGQFTVGQVTVPQGQVILMNLASANRDPEVFERGTVFEVSRAAPTHLSFSWGAHYCLGASIARMEARIALDTLLDRFAAIEFDGAPPEWKPYTALRSLESLHVQLEAT
jgi:cytochrome P450